MFNSSRRNDYYHISISQDYVLKLLSKFLCINTSIMNANSHSHIVNNKINYLTEI